MYLEQSKRARGREGGGQGREGMGEGMGQVVQGLGEDLGFYPREVRALEGCGQKRGGALLRCS